MQVAEGMMWAWEGAGFSLATGLAVSLAILVLIVAALRSMGASKAVSFLIAGIAIGPHGLGLVQNPEFVHGLVEAAAMLLFFLIGTQLRFARLAGIKQCVGLAMLYTLVTICSACVVFISLDFSLPVSLFTGFLVAAGGVILIYGSEDGEAIGLHRHRGFRGVLLAQGILVLLMLLLVPVIAGVEDAASDFPGVLFMLLGFTVVGLTVSLQFLPHHLESRGRGSRGGSAGPLVAASVVVLTFAAADIGVAVGMFVAGWIMSESRYRGRPIGDLLPLRSLAVGSFYIALGMLLNVRFFIDHWDIVVVCVVAVIGLKEVVFRIITAQVSVQRALIPAAGGILLPAAELAFLIFYAGRSVGLRPAGIGPGDEDTFVAVAVAVLVAYTLAAALKSMLPRNAGRVRAWIWSCLTNANLCAGLSPVVSREGRKPISGKHFSLEAGDDGSRVEEFDAVTSTLRPIWGGSGRGRLCLRTAAVQTRSMACSRSLADLQLPERLGVEVMALWIGDVYYQRPEPDHVLQEGDLVVLSGTPTMVSISSRLFKSMPFSAPTDSETA